MLKSIVITCFILLTAMSFGQNEVQWSYLYNGGTGNIELHAEIAEGWHLYSQHIENEIGPIPTSFEFSKNIDVKFIGSVEEPEAIKEYDPNFEGELNFFKDKVIFTQEVEIKKPTTVVGVVTYMVCNSTMCMPPTDEIFRITIQ